MDGTTAAYHQAVEKLVPDLHKIKTEDEYIEKVIIPHFGGDLFINLKPLPLYHYINRYNHEVLEMALLADICFVSFIGHHIHSLNSLRNKRQWLFNHNLDDYSEFIPLIGKYEDRALLADKNSLLFDDDSYTIDLFIENGGQGVIVDPSVTETTEEGYQKFKTIINTFLRN